MHTYREVPEIVIEDDCSLGSGLGLRMPLQEDEDEDEELAGGLDESVGR